MKRKSLFRSTAIRLLVVLLCLWLLAMVLLTAALAGDIQRQAQPVFAAALEKELARAGEDYPLLGDEMTKPEALDGYFAPESLSFTPETSLPLLRSVNVTPQRAWILLDEKGILREMRGLKGWDMALGHTGVTLWEEKYLAYYWNPSLFRSINRTFSTFSGRSVDGTLLAFEGSSRLFSAAFPLQGELDYDPAERFHPAAPPSRELVSQTDPRLLDGLEEGRYRFGSNRLRLTTLLRGRWLRDGDGQKRWFLMAALDWDPLSTAAEMLAYIYPLTLAVFLLAWALLCLTLRRSLIRPLRELGRAVDGSPLSVTEREFDYRFRYGEVQDLLSKELLRRQMLAAGTPAGDIPPEACPVLLTALQRAEDKLLPILMDRGQRLRRELEADGRIPTSFDQLEDCLLALFREALAYAEQNCRMVLRTEEKSGFLLAEVRVKSRRGHKEKEFSALWNGIYRRPLDGDAPGAKLRKAVAVLPGAFAGVYRTKDGLALVLGLPYIK